MGLPVAVSAVVAAVAAANVIVEFAAVAAASAVVEFDAIAVAGAASAVVEFVEVEESA